jgi:hypothetical protein
MHLWGKDFLLICVDDCGQEEATAKANAGILRCAQDDDVKENAQDD